MREIVKVSLQNEMDLVLTHRRSMKLAELAGLSLSAQTTFATAVSEVARMVIEHGRNGVLVLGIFTSSPQKSVAAYIYDKRSSSVLLQDPPLQNARRLVDRLQLSATPEGSCVEMYYRVPVVIKELEKKIADWRALFEEEPPISPYEEIKRKNEQLQELAAKLKASETQYRTLTNALPLMIFTLNGDGDIVYANDWLPFYTGLPPASISQHNWKTIVHPDDYAAFYALFTDIITSEGGAVKIQCRIRDARTGNYNWHLIFITPLEEGHMPGEHFIGYIVDIHAQKEFEQALRDNQELKKIQERLRQNEAALRQNINQLNRSNTDLQQFAYVASHDLQEPVRKMIFYSDYFYQNYTHLIDDKGSTFLQNMLHASHRMRNLINDLLSFAKIRKEDTVFEQVDLNIVASEALRDLDMVITEKKASITIGPLPAVEGNQVQLIQLFGNIIGNSLKYSQTHTTPIIHVAATSTENAVDICFSDNGIGFETKYLPKMFTLFQRLHGIGEYEGTGFGLAICKKIIDLHNGAIDASSTPGEGAVFTVSLPFINLTKIQAMAFDIKILLADDDKEDQLILSDAFQQIGITNAVHFEDNGEGALQHLESSYRNNTLPHLIILDLNMPRMNGTQTLRILKQDNRFNHIPIIIYSTSLNNIERDECIRLGAHSYIIKPLTFTEYIKSAEYFYHLCLPADPASN